MGILKRMFGRRNPQVSAQSLPREGRAPEFLGIESWVNSEPLTMASLRGKVVLVDFWTYSCVNCVRTLPHLNAWHETYAKRGLVIVGVHTPEFEFEREKANVEAAVARFGIRYPVALDTGFATWEAYRNRYWPAHYFVDAKGDIRYHHFGEGAYEHSEAVIRALLDETGADTGIKIVSEGIDAGADFKRIGTSETYLGFSRLEYLGSPESVRKDAVRRYTAISEPASNIFYFDGEWEIRDDYAVPRTAGASIIYRVTAAKANLVMGADGASVRVRVTLDGGPLDDASRGADADGDSTVTVTDGRLYELVDLRGAYGTHLLRLEFLDPGAKCYAFTFG